MFIQQTFVNKQEFWEGSKMNPNQIETHYGHVSPGPH